MQPPSANGLLSWPLQRRDPNRANQDRSSPRSSLPPSTLWLSPLAASFRTPIPLVMPRRAPTTISSPQLRSPSLSPPPLSKVVISSTGAIARYAKGGSSVRADIAVFNVTATAVAAAVTALNAATTATLTATVVTAAAVPLL